MRARTDWMWTGAKGTGFSPLSNCTPGTHWRWRCSCPTLCLSSALPVSLRGRPRSTLQECPAAFSWTFPLPRWPVHLAILLVFLLLGVKIRNCHNSGTSQIRKCCQAKPEVSLGVCRMVLLSSKGIKQRKPTSRKASNTSLSQFNSTGSSYLTDRGFSLRKTIDQQEPQRSPPSILDLDWPPDFLHSLSGMLQVAIPRDV